MSKQKEQGDLRIRRTKKMLREALLSLIPEKGYYAITVGDIAERAMVNRATFYRHYEDKEDLLLRGIDEVLQELVEQLKPLPHSKIRRKPLEKDFLPSLALMLHHVDQHAQFYRVMLGEHGMHSVFLRLQRFNEDYTLKSLNQILPAARPAGIPREFQAGIVSAALLWLLNWWLNNKGRYSIEEVSGYLFRILGYGILGSPGLQPPLPSEGPS